MVSVSINLDGELMKALKKRAKENFMSASEMAEDIVRKSIVSWSKKGKRYRFKVDDKLVRAFSRQKQGRPRRVSRV